MTATLSVKVDVEGRFYAFDPSPGDSLGYLSIYLSMDNRNSHPAHVWPLALITHRCIFSSRCATEARRMFRRPVRRNPVVSSSERTNTSRGPCATAALSSANVIHHQCFYFSFGDGLLGDFFTCEVICASTTFRRFLLYEYKYESVRLFRFPLPPPTEDPPQLLKTSSRSAKFTVR